MLMINLHHHPTVELPPLDPDQDLVISPQTKSYFKSLHRYLPSSTTADFSDEFRMYEFKVRKCNRVRSHDWTDCPFAHPGEKARRRDPRKRTYSGTPCPEYRRGICSKGDSCEFAHGVFECWLHPTRYRTQPCNDGLSCRRRVCFFAHTSEELRVVSESPSYVGELVGGMRGLQIGSKLTPRMVRVCGFGYGSSSQMGCVIREVTRSGLEGLEEEVTMERVESGKGIRARMYAKLSRDNSLGWGRGDSASPGPDFGWVSELVN